MHGFSSWTGHDDDDQSSQLDSSEILFKRHADERLGSSAGSSFSSVMERRYGETLSPFQQHTAAQMLKGCVLADTRCWRLLSLNYACVRRVCLNLPRPFGNSPERCSSRQRAPAGRVGQPG